MSIKVISSCRSLGSALARAQPGALAVEVAASTEAAALPAGEERGCARMPRVLIPGRLKFSGYQRFVVALLAFLQFSIVLHFMIISPRGAIIMPDLNIGPQRFGEIVSAYAFSAGISGLLAADCPNLQVLVARPPARRQPRPLPASLRQVDEGYVPPAASPVHATGQWSSDEHADPIGSMHRHSFSYCFFRTIASSPSLFPLQSSERPA